MNRGGMGMGKVKGRGLQGLESVSELIDPISVRVTNGIAETKGFFSILVKVRRRRVYKLTCKMGQDTVQRLIYRVYYGAII